MMIRQTIEQMLTEKLIRFGPELSARIIKKLDNKDLVNSLRSALIDEGLDNLLPEFLEEVISV